MSLFRKFFKTELVEKPIFKLACETIYTVEEIDTFIFLKGITVEQADVILKEYMKTNISLNTVNHFLRTGELQSFNVEFKNGSYIEELGKVKNPFAECKGVSDVLLDSRQ